MTTARRLGAAWAVLGIVLVLGDAIVRVWPYTRDGLRDGLTAVQWTVLVVWVAAMLVVEGYRGFQQRFAPRFAARRVQLLHDGRGVDLVLAPLFCIGFFHAGRRQIAGAWALTLGIVVVVVLVGLVEQPWRGIIDAGVLAGLAYGLVSVLVALVRSGRPSRPGPLADGPTVGP